MVMDVIGELLAQELLAVSLYAWHQRTHSCPRDRSVMGMVETSKLVSNGVLPDF